MTVLGKVTGEMLFGVCCSVGKALMIAVVVFVRACHSRGAVLAGEG